MNEDSRAMQISVVIPCYKTKKHILNLIDSIGPEVSSIIVIDDNCPQETGHYVLSEVKDSRVQVIFNNENLGVGGSTLNGYRRAMELGAEVVVKLDGDGQMDPVLIPRLVAPIASGMYDYVKGNRFWTIENLKEMPKIRLLGNLILSFLAKASTGYWNLFDPNNGLTAIRTSVLHKLRLEKIESRFFFESDMLYHLYLEDARTTQIPMRAKYADEVSNLKIHKIVFEFLFKHTRNFTKRIFYSYFLRDFSFATVNFLCGTMLLTFSIVRGLSAWINSSHRGVPTETGTQILVAITFISGLQMLLGFINSDIERSYRK